MLNYRLITKNNPVCNDYELKILNTLDEVKQFIEDNYTIAIGTENSGLDPHTGYEYCIQIGNEKIQYIIDMLSFKYSEIKELLEVEDKLFVGQHLKHDLQWFYKHNIVLKSKLWDTYLAEVRLTNGIDNISRNLQALEQKYLKTAFVDKSQRKDVNTIPKSGYTEPVMKHSAGDIYILPLLYQKQLEASKEASQTRIVELECEFVKVLAYTEYCGIYADVKKLQDAVVAFNYNAAKSKEFLTKLILKTENTKYIDPQLSLFDDEPSVSVNFDDTNAMKEILLDIGGLELADYSNSSENSSLGNLLRSSTKGSKIVNEYGLYIENKRKSRLCESLIRAQNPKTKRIHTSFFQIGKTGRLSSGDKNPNHPNIMGIDKDDTIRGCFIVHGNGKLFNYDYDNMEYHIYSIVSNNQAIKNELSLNQDGHSEVARVIFNKELEHFSNEYIKERFPKHRNAAKRIRYIILNGGDGRTIARSFGCSSAQGNKVYDKYNSVYTVDNQLVSSLTLKSIFNGYIITDNKFGGRCVLKDSKKYSGWINKYKLLDGRFWDKYKDEKELDSEWYNEMKPIVTEFSQYKKSVRSKVLSHLTQGIGSGIFKIAGIKFFNKIIEHGQFNKVMITNLVNDEYLIESHDDTRNWGEELKTQMIEASKVYCGDFPLKVSGGECDSWKH